MKIFVSLLFFAALLLYPEAAARGVRDGLTLAAEQALPALFPFFVAGGLLTRTGAADKLARLIARPFCALYGLPPSAAPAILLGLTGGYPVGAATACELLRSGALSAEEAGQVNRFCNCASPGFCIALVGLGIFGSSRTGAILYGIHALAALATGLMVSRQPRYGRGAALPAAPPHGENPAAAFCAATEQAAATALTVTAMLTVFSVLLALLRPVLGIIPEGAMLAGLLELTNGLAGLPLLPLPVGAQLALVSFLLGFGGLAVQFQVRALAAPCGLPLDGFFSAKLLHGALAAALTAVVFRLSPNTLTVFAPVRAAAPSGNRLPFFFLLFLVLFVIGGRKKAKNTV